jgi:hypothetical protein
MRAMNASSALAQFHCSPIRIMHDSLNSPGSLSGRGHDLCANALEFLDNLGQVLDGKAQSGRMIDRRALVRQRLNLDHHIAYLSCKMDWPFPMLLFGKSNAKRLKEKPKRFDLASFQDQELEQNLVHAPPSNANCISSWFCSTLPRHSLPGIEQSVM